MALQEKEAITDRRLLWQSLTVLGLVIVALVLHPVLHHEPSVVALLGAGLLVAATKVTTEQALEEVEWDARLLRRPVRHGRRPGRERRHRRHLPRRRGHHRRPPRVRDHAPAGASAVLSAIVDHIPYVATMRPIVSDLVQQQPAGTAPSCRERSPSAPASTATPPPSAPAPTPSSSASPPATAHRSISGNSLNTA
ncbi:MULTISPECIES: transporter permease [Actinomadura]|uniref:hypothetical protein n=1 Tax=unclassified Actinomadura TaxID=2626254 RepID=UPI00339985BE